MEWNPYYLNVKLRWPMRLPSANTLTLYVPGLRVSLTFQYIVTGVSLPVYSMVLAMVYCSERFSYLNDPLAPITPPAGVVILT